MKRLWENVLTRSGIKTNKGIYVLWIFKTKQRLIGKLCEIIISGEEKDLIVSLLGKIPRRVLSRIQHVITEHQCQPTRPDGEPIPARYEPQTRIITIYANPSDPEYPCYLYHEIGHCIFNEFEEVVYAAKDKCQIGDTNRLHLDTIYSGDIWQWASEFCAKAYALFKSEQLTHDIEHYRAMIEYFETNEF